MSIASIQSQSLNRISLSQKEKTLALFVVALGISAVALGAFESSLLDYSAALYGAGGAVVSLTVAVCIIAVKRRKYEQRKYEQTLGKLQPGRAGVTFPLGEKLNILLSKLGIQASMNALLDNVIDADIRTRLAFFKSKNPCSKSFPIADLRAYRESVALNLGTKKCPLVEKLKLLNQIDFGTDLPANIKANIESEIENISFVSMSNKDLVENFKKIKNLIKPQASVASTNVIMVSRAHNYLDEMVLTLSQERMFKEHTSIKQFITQLDSLINTIDTSIRLATSREKENLTLSAIFSEVSQILNQYPSNRQMHGDAVTKIVEMACVYSQVTWIELLINKKLMFIMHNKKSLVYAIQYGRLKIFQVLIGDNSKSFMAQKFDVNGNGLLHLAVEALESNIVNLLLRDYKGDRQALNGLNETSMDVLNSTRVSALLQKNPHKREDFQKIQRMLQIK